MKISEAIARVDSLRPNQYGKDMKMQWLSEVEGTIVDNVLNRSEGNDISFEKYDYETDNEKELLVPDRFCDLYLHYLIAKIDYHDNETESYMNDVTMYQASYDAFAAWYIRTHMPKQPGVIRGW